MFNIKPQDLIKKSKEAIKEAQEAIRETQDALKEVRGFMRGNADETEAAPRYSNEQTAWNRGFSDIEKQNIDELCKEIKRFLSLQPQEDRMICHYGYPGYVSDQEEIVLPGEHREYDVGFFECYDSFIRREALIAAERRADDLLDDFFRADKIRGLLEAFSGFIETIEDGDEPEMTAQIVFSNYIYYIERQVKNAIEAYDQYKGEMYARESHPGVVCEFISRECQAIACLKDLPIAWKIISDKQSGKMLTREQISELTAIYELFKRRDQENHAHEEIEALNQRFAKQAEKRNSKIRQAAELRIAIGKLLTDEWFRRLYPQIPLQDGGVKGMTAKQLREWYKEHLAPIEQNLLNRF